MVLGSSLVAVNSRSDFAAASRKEFLDIQATIDFYFSCHAVLNRSGKRCLTVHIFLLGLFQTNKGFNKSSDTEFKDFLNLYKKAPFYFSEWC